MPSRDSFATLLKGVVVSLVLFNAADAVADAPVCAGLFTPSIAKPSSAKKTTVKMTESDVQWLNQFYSAFRGVIGARMIDGYPVVTINSPQRAKTIPIVQFRGHPIRFEVVQRPMRLTTGPGDLLIDFKEAKKLRSELSALLQASDEMKHAVEGVYIVTVGGPKLALQVLVRDAHAIANVPKTYKGKRVDTLVVHPNEAEYIALYETDLFEAKTVAQDAAAYFEERFENFIDVQVVESVQTSGAFAGVKTYHLRARFDGNPSDQIEPYFRHLLVEFDLGEKISWH